VANVRIDLDQVQLQVLLRSDDGVVGKDAMKRGKRVEAAAKRRVRVRTGRLQRSIKARRDRSEGEASVVVEATAKHARFVHDGTGVYGPTGLPIQPKTRSVLKFRVGGVTIFAPSVRGQHGTHFLRDALPAAVE
jgi:HK97 gp10 family phage protein